MCGGGNMDEFELDKFVLKIDMRCIYKTLGKLTWMPQKIEGGSFEKVNSLFFESDIFTCWKKFLQMETYQQSEIC